MSSSGFATLLVIQPKFSIRFLVILTVQHLLALWVLPWLDLPWPIIALSAVFVCLSLYRTTRHHVFHQGPRAITQLIWERGAVIRIRDGERRESEATLGQGSFVNLRLIILNLKLQQKGRCVLILFPEMAESDAYRLLRVRLLMTPNL